jgi:hypothetical protein
MAWIEHLRVKARFPRTAFGILLYAKLKMVSECVEYASDHKRIIFEIYFDYFRLINRKCASDYSDDRLLFFVQLPITTCDSESIQLCNVKIFPCKYALWRQIKRSQRQIYGGCATLCANELGPPSLNRKCRIIFKTVETSCCNYIVKGLNFKNCTTRHVGSWILIFGSQPQNLVAHQLNLYIYMY